MQSTKLQRLISFLKNELAIPATSIDLAVRHHSEPSNLKIDVQTVISKDAQGEILMTSFCTKLMEPNLLPMILWQYGLITLEQLNLIFDWLEIT